MASLEPVREGEFAYYRVLFNEQPCRIYILPGVPAPYHTYPQEPSSFPFEKVLSSEFPGPLQHRVRSLWGKYSKRRIDTLGVLIYAKEQRRFDEIADLLDSKFESNFKDVLKTLQFARSDLTLFFKELYFKLGHAQEEDVQQWRDLNKYGAGLIVFEPPSMQD